MTQYQIPLSKIQVVFCYVVVLIFGILFMRTLNLTSITFGLCVFVYGIHEISHLLVLFMKGYGVKGIIISIWPPAIGTIPDPEIEEKDATVVFISGLFSLIIPILLVIIYPALSYYLLVIALVAISLSAYDFKYLRELKKIKQN